MRFDKDLSVDVTLWRINLPQDTDVLHCDRNLGRLNSSEGENMLQNLSAGLPSQLQWKLPQQGGQTLVFFKQGPPGELSLYTAGHQTFSILAWIVDPHPVVVSIETVSGVSADTSAAVSPDSEAEPKAEPETMPAEPAHAPAHDNGDAL